MPLCLFAFFHFCFWFFFFIFDLWCETSCIWFWLRRFFAQGSGRIFEMFQNKISIEPNCVEMYKILNWAHKFISEEQIKRKVDRTWPIEFFVWFRVYFLFIFFFCRWNNYCLFAVCERRIRIFLVRFTLIECSSLQWNSNANCNMLMGHWEIGLFTEFFWVKNICKIPRLLTKRMKEECKFSFWSNQNKPWIVVFFLFFL